MLNFLKSFANDEAGAVTVDWVVLTAAIVGIGVAVLAQITGNVTTMADNIGLELVDQNTALTTGY